MGCLVIAEHDHQQLRPNTLNVISAAVELSNEVDILVIGYQCETVAKEAANIESVKQILYCDAECYQHFLAENMAALIAEIAKKYSHVLIPANTFGKNILPRVAVLLDVAQISDVVKIENIDTFIRPIYAGNAYATVQSEDPIKLITVRTTAFSKAKKINHQTTITSLNQVMSNSHTQFVKQELSQSTHPELTTAKIIISGGRGLQSKEQFKTIEKIADLLGAAVGASRAAVDSGFVSNDYQVGQTGKVVAPELYIAVGISGAIQHIAGMQDSKVIVAINKDPEAPIFEIADYGLVADWFAIFSELESSLRSCS